MTETWHDHMTVEERRTWLNKTTTMTSSEGNTLVMTNSDICDMLNLLIGQVSFDLGKKLEHLYGVCPRERCPKEFCSYHC